MDLDLRSIGRVQTKAGVYEVAHEGDKDGYLSSDWAKKAGEAIEVGIKYGLVVIDSSLIQIQEKKL